MTQQEYDDLKSSLDGRTSVHFGGRTACDQAGLDFIAKAEGFTPKAPKVLSDPAPAKATPAKTAAKVETPATPSAVETKVEGTVKEQAKAAAEKAVLDGEAELTAETDEAKKPAIQSKIDAAKNALKSLE